MAEQETAVRGRVTWHTSGEGCGPDIGISIGLGGGKTLWCGEITRARWESAGLEAEELGDDFGTWLVLYGPTEDETHVLGRLLSDGVASDKLVSALEVALAAGERPAGRE